MKRSLQEIWSTFRSLQFESKDLEELLFAAHATLDPNSFVGQMGRTLVHEEVAKRPLPIPLEEARNHPTTRRIDGILPLAIPSCRNIEILVDETLTEAWRNGLRYPAKDRMEDFRKELSLSYLAFLHRRQLRSSHRLEIEMRVECPHSAYGGQVERLRLMGTLPLGGVITIFTSRLPAVDWGELSPSDVGHSRSLSAIREDGRLRLVESR